MVPPVAVDRSVFSVKKYPNHDVALTAALAEMKGQMTKYLGNSDTMNYKHDVLQKTLKQ
jgi:hypothetical protein